MTNRFTMCAALMAFGAILICGCKSEDKDDHMMSKTSSMSSTAVAMIKPAQAAATQPSNKNVMGDVSFTSMDNGVKVVAHLSGLSPGKHGFHIHESGDLSDPALKSAGAHFNPAHTHHGGPDTPEHHAGDIGNITADAQGNAHLEIMLMNVKLDELVGKSVIVHAGVDDLKTDPAGNSGGRVAGGVIEMRQ
jgi:Cu-Zn family superoxide dismutase